MLYSFPMLMVRLIEHLRTALPVRMGITGESNRPPPRVASEHQGQPVPTTLLMVTVSILLDETQFPVTLSVNKP